jgi:hypothetical protein
MSPESGTAAATMVAAVSLFVGLMVGCFTVAIAAS